METNTTKAGMGNATLVISSYKKAQVFRRDYVRHNRAFVRFEKSSANHSYAYVTLAAGDTLEARGSTYVLGATRWNAADCQSWARFEFEVRNGTVVALNYAGVEMDFPAWARVVEAPAAALELPPVAAVAAVIIAAVAQSEFLF